MPTVGDYEYLGNVTTSNATPTTVLTYALADNTSVHIHAEIVGRKSDGTTMVETISTGFKRTSGGNATEVGTHAHVESFKDAGAATWDVTATGSSGNILIQVTGAASSTIYWRCFLKVHLLTP